MTVRGRGNNMKTNILIVEDESIVSMEIESYLLTLNYNVVAICSTADDAVEKVMKNNVDLVLMDIYLDNSNGIEATRRIRQHKPNLPVIFISANMDEDTINQAISINPQAYLLKPFNRKELAIAIKIALYDHKNDTIKRNKNEGDIYLDNEFSFNKDSSKLICCNEEVILTKKERSLLLLFLNNQNQLLSIETIEYELWPDKPSNDNRRRSLIFRLRSKLKHKFIQTHSSEGYTFNTL